MSTPETGNGPSQDGQTERLDRGLTPAKDRAGGRPCYLPTWGCGCLRLSVGLGAASLRVTGWLMA